jgi:GDP-L-fucose synthase
MENKNAADIGELVNIGTGHDLTIRELAGAVRRIVYADAPGRTCEIKWDTSKPNGTLRKLLDVSRLRAMGWQAKTSLETGIAQAYADFCGNTPGV